MKTRADNDISNPRYSDVVDEDCFGKNFEGRDNSDMLYAFFPFLRIFSWLFTSHEQVPKSSGIVLRNCNNWERTIPVNRPCALLAVNVGQAVCAENGGRASLVANRQTCGGSWETFIIVNIDDGSFSLKSAANDKFVSAFPDGRMIAQGSVVDAWEKFDLKPVQGKDGVFTLWSRNTQKYVSVDENKGNVLIADRDVADTWEEFRIFCL